MARPQRNNVDYFPHEAKHGKKMFYVTQKYGNDGYATWFIIIEKLCDAEYHYLNLSDNMQLMYLTSQCRIDETKLKNILNDLAIFGSINIQLWTEKQIVWSQKLVDSINDAYKKRSNECITLKGLVTLLKGLGVLKQGFRLSTVPVKPQSKVEKSKEDIYTHPLQKFIKDNYPNVSNLKLQITNKQCIDLKKKYSTELITQKLDAMENKKTLTKNYNSVSLTLNNWCKSEKKVIEKSSTSGTIN